MMVMIIIVIIVIIIIIIIIMDCYKRSQLSPFYSIIN
jgi:hypothetical protein